MKLYFATIESDHVAAFTTALVAADPDAIAAEYERLPECEIVGRYCCRPPQRIGTATEKVVAMVSTTMPRKQFKKLPGVVRVRTTPNYARVHPGVTVC